MSWTLAQNLAYQPVMDWLYFSTNNCDAAFHIWLKLSLYYIIQVEMRQNFVIKKKIPGRGTAEHNNDNVSLFRLSNQQIRRVLIA